MENKKRFDGFAVASFVMSLVAVAMFFLILDGFQNSSPNKMSSILFIGYVIYGLILAVSLVFGIIALVRIGKNNLLRGKTLATFGIVISVMQTFVPIVINLWKYGIQFG